MKNFITTIFAALLLVAFSAQAAEGIYLGPSLSYYYLDSDRTIDSHDESGLVGLNLGYRFFNDWALELGVGRDITGDDLDVAQINYYYFFGDDGDNWRPYVVAGLSYYDRDEDINLQPEEENTHQAQIGLGLSSMLSDQWEFRADARLLHKVREGQSGTNDGAVNLALNYFFSKPAVPVADERPVRVAERTPEAAEEPEKRVITIRLNVEFEFDEAVVLAIYGDELEAVAAAMKAHEDIDLVLEGHTDSLGSNDYNQDLSDRRATAVKAKLVEDYGIDANRVSAVGYGESRPIADNDTDEGRARNRRVVGEMSYSEIVVE